MKKSKFYGCFLFSSLFFMIVSANKVEAANTTTVGALSLVATFECMSVYSNFSEDVNANNNATLEYRKSGATSWTAGMAMTVDRRATVTAADSTYTNPYKNQWRASILGLIPKTKYEVRVTYTDADGISNATTVSDTLTTRTDNIQPGAAGTFYVSPSGSNVNPGTIDLPFKTLAKAGNAAVAGSVIYVRAGSYNDILSISNSGTSSNWIIVRNYPGETPIIDAAYIRGNCMNLSGSYILVRGFRCIRANQNAIELGSSAQNVIIDSNIILDFKGSAIYGGMYNTISQIKNITIQNNMIQRLTMQGDDMVNIWNTQGGHILRNNCLVNYKYTRTSSAYFDGFAGGGNWRIEGFMHRDADIYNNYIEGPNDDAIEMDGGNINVRVWQNVIKNTYDGISICPVAVGPCYIFRNIITLQDDGNAGCFKAGNNSNGYTYIYNNTIYMMGAYNGLQKTNPGMNNYVFRNNILRTGRYVFEGTGTHNLDYDVMSTTDAGRFIDYNGQYGSVTAFASGTGNETHGIQKDAQTELIAPATMDFRLNPSSTLIDKGVLLTGFNDANTPWAFKGANPDIGACENGADITWPQKKTVPVVAVLPFHLSAGLKDFLISPNPLNNGTKVQIKGIQAPITTLSIYNAKGELVRSFSREQIENDGFLWNARDLWNRPVTNGAYLIRVDTKDVSVTQKLILQK